MLFEPELEEAIYMKDLWAALERFDEASTAVFYANTGQDKKQRKELAEAGVSVVREFAKEVIRRRSEPVDVDDREEREKISFESLATAIVEVDPQAGFTAMLETVMEEFEGVFTRDEWNEQVDDVITFAVWKKFKEVHEIE